MDLPVLLLQLAFTLPASGPPAIAEVTIGHADFTRRYLDAGLPDTLPQVLVHSPQDVCVALLDGSVRGRLGAAIADAISKADQACTIPPAADAKGGTAAAPAEASAAPRAAVELLVFDAPFCGACDQLREELSRLAAAEPNYTIRFTKVNLGKAFNPERAGTLAPRADRNPPPPR